MKSKLLGLLIALLVPIAFFLFFDHFDYFQAQGRKNLPKLPRYGALPPDSEQPNKVIANDSLWHTIPDFAFTAHTGKPVTRQTMTDKIVVTDFFFTKCPSICPKMTSQLKRVQKEFLTEGDVLILSHTVDPHRDSVETLQTYAGLYEADSSMWLFLTGAKPELYEIARKGYFVSATEGNGSEEDFIHTEKFVLVDKSGVIRGYYDGTDSIAVNKLLTDIKLLKLEYPMKKKEMVLDRERSAKEAENSKTLPYKN